MTKNKIKYFPFEKLFLFFTKDEAEVLSDG
jgi:hypothetical protein